MKKKTYKKTGNVVYLSEKRPKKEETQATKDVTFKEFFQHVLSQNTEAAAKCLEVLLGIYGKDSKQATIHFSKLLSSEPNFTQRAMNLALLVKTAKASDCLQEILHIFGLSGPQAVVALGSLKDRL